MYPKGFHFVLSLHSEEEVSTSLAKEYDRPMLAAKKWNGGWEVVFPGDRKDLRAVTRSSEHE